MISWEFFPIAVVAENRFTTLLFRFAGILSSNFSSECAHSIWLMRCSNTMSKLMKNGSAVPQIPVKSSNFHESITIRIGEKNRHHFIRMSETKKLESINWNLCLLQRVVFYKLSLSDESKSKKKIIIMGNSILFSRHGSRPLPLQCEFDRSFRASCMHHILASDLCVGYCIPSIRKRWPSHISLFIYSNRNRRWRERGKKGQWNDSIGHLHSWIFPWARFMFYRTVIFFSLLSFAERVRVRVCGVWSRVSYFSSAALLVKMVRTLEKKCAEYFVKKGNAKNEPIVLTQQFIHRAVYCIRHATLYAVQAIHIFT